jgi:hypothetical protein
MTEPTIAYNADTGEVFVLELPESEADLDKPAMCVKIGELEPRSFGRRISGANAGGHRGFGPLVNS